MRRKVGVTSSSEWVVWSRKGCSMLCGILNEVVRASNIGASIMMIPSFCGLEVDRWTRHAERKRCSIAKSFDS